MRAAKTWDAGVAPGSFHDAVDIFVVSIEDALMTQLVRERDLRRRFVGERLAEGGKLGAVVAVALGTRRNRPRAGHALLPRISARVIRVTQAVVVDRREKAEAVDVLTAPDEAPRDRLPDPVGFPDSRH